MSEEKKRYRTPTLSEKQKEWCERLVFSNKYTEDVKFDDCTVPITKEALYYRDVFDNKNRHEWNRKSKELLKQRKIQEYIQELNAQKKRHKISNSMDILVFWSETMKNEKEQIQSRLKASENLAKHYQMYENRDDDKDKEDDIPGIDMARRAIVQEVENAKKKG